MREKLIKTMIIVVGILVICGTVGFGVFSYYYANGSMTMATDTNYTSIFNPVVSFNGGYENFIADSSSDIELDCQDETNVGEEVVCTGYLTVYNEGTNSIRVEVYDMSLTPYSETIEGIVLSSQDFDADKETFEIEPGNSDEVHFTVKYQLDYDRQNAIQLTTSTSINTYYVMTANVKVKATEIIE